MNKTKVRLLGKGYPIQCDSLDRETSFYEYPLILKGVELVQYVGDCEWEDITKKKGKYVKGKIIREEIKDELGDIILLDYARNCDFEYEFEIEHEGEFNPKSIQLLKSDYEFEDIPYAILANKILYDGKEIQTITEEYDLVTLYNHTKKVKWDGFYYSNNID